MPHPKRLRRIDDQTNVDRIEYRHAVKERILIVFPAECDRRQLAACRRAREDLDETIGDGDDGGP